MNECSLSISVSEQVLELGADPHPLIISVVAPELALSTTCDSQPLILSAVSAPELVISSEVYNLILQVQEAPLDLGVHIPLSVQGSPANAFIANCLGSDAVGDCVYVTGPAVGGRYQVTKVEINDTLKVPSIGIITVKIDAETCVVQWIGELAGVVGALAPGRTYFVGPDAKITIVAPVAPVTGYRYIQRIGVALSTDVLLLIPRTDMTKVIALN
jgi:hypothetical protein